MKHGAEFATRSLTARTGNMWNYPSVGGAYLNLPTLVLGKVDGPGKEPDTLRSCDTPAAGVMAQGPDGFTSTMFGRMV